MNTSRLMIVNGALFVVIVALATLIIVQKRELPGEPPVDQVKSTVDRLIERDKSTAPPESGRFMSMGKVNVFETIIPIPPPTPAPPKPTPAPPKIEEVTEFWRLVGPLRKFASFNNMKTNADFTVNMGETFIETYRGKQIPVTLEATDMKKFTATISINEDGQKQTRVMSAF